MWPFSVFPGPTEDAPSISLPWAPHMNREAGKQVEVTHRRMLECSSRPNHGERYDCPLTWWSAPSRLLTLS